MATSIAAPAYWIVRSYLERQPELLARALAASLDNPSPFVQGCRARMKDPDARLAAMQTKLSG